MLLYKAAIQQQYIKRKPVATIAAAKYRWLYVDFNLFSPTRVTFVTNTFYDVAPEAEIFVNNPSSNGICLRITS